MLRQCLFCLSLFFIVCLALPVHAAEFQPLGYEAISMGGAGVASSKGSYAPYYNPALLAKKRHTVEISLSAGVGAREVNLVDSIDTLADIDLDETIEQLENINYNNITFSNYDPSTFNPANPPSISVGEDTAQLSEDVTTIKKVLVSLSNKNGLALMPNVALATQIGSFGLGVYGIGEASAYAVVDPLRTDLIVNLNETYQGGQSVYVELDNDTNSIVLSTEEQYNQRSLDVALSSGTTYLVLDGLIYTEVPVAYGMTIPSVPGTLSIGGSAKFMSATTYHGEVSIDTESGDISDELEDYEESDSTIGLDLGALYTPPMLSSLTLGLVAKNLNSPEFKRVGGTTSIDPQIRAGVAYDLGNTLSLAFDLDLTANETYIKGYDAQFMGGGVSFHPASWFSLRGGAMTNIQESDEGLIFTAGLGLGLKWLQLDLAAQMSSKSGEFDGTEIPRYTRVQLSFVSKWN